jgi:N-acetylglucosamine malate deacetylase 1
MRILAVFAHPDDELGCVGTLAKHAARGDDVMLVWTTHGELASQYLKEGEAEVRRIRQEHGALVAEKVGAKHYFFDMGDSRMTGSRTEALMLARLYAQFRPDAVLTWSDDHPHPDHRMTAKIAFDAVTLARIPKIINEDAPESLEPHRSPVRFYQYVSHAVSYPLVHVAVGEQLELATELFCFYRDFYGWAYSAEDFRQSLAQRGREASVGYAEAFQLRSRVLPAVSHLP